jgi:cell division protein FtsX
MWGLVPGDDDWKRSETAVVVPLGLLPTTARTGEVDWVILRAAPRDVPETATAIERFLGERGRDVEVGTNMVWPLLASKGLDRYLALNRALFLACLVMGGVVITNLMLLSVLERTREIAIRRTEGAARGDILAQFLGEAFLMGVLGTLVGVPLGLALARVRVALEPVSMLVVEIPWSAIVVVASMAVATSVLAGLLPALRAARLEPVEAMRCD